MKITHYCPRMVLADGGVVRAVLDVCALLEQAGHEVVLLSYDDRDVPEAWKAGAGAIRSVCLEKPAGALGLFGAAAIEAATPHVRTADVVHLHTPWAPPNRQLARIAGRAGRPYVLTLHGMLDDWCMTQRGVKKRLYLALGGRRLLEQAAYVHCTARAEAEQASKWFPGGQARVIPLVFDLDPYRQLPDPALAADLVPNRGSSPMILFLSRLDYKKGPDVLIEAAAKLAGRGVDFHLAFAGTGDEPYVRDLRAQISRHGLDTCVTFTGLVTGDTKLAVYRAADLFALPTSQENFGMVFPEALACETPVVTTKGVDIWPELEASGGAAITTRDPGELAATLETLLADLHRCAEMGRAGRAWVFDTFDGDRILDEYVAMYEEAKP